jgi:hypothetical protein
MVSADLHLKALGNAAFCRSASRATRNHLERAALDTLTQMWRALARERNLLTEADFSEQFELLTAAQKKILGPIRSDSALIVDRSTGPCARSTRVYSECSLAVDAAQEIASPIPW